MSKDQELDYSGSAGFNTDIAGVSIAEGIPPSNLNDAMRAMAKLRHDAITRHVIKTAGTYTAVKTDHNQYWRCTGDVTINLSAAATLTDGWILFVRANGGTVTIDPSGSELIDGGTTLSMIDGQTAQIVCTGTDFYQIDQGFTGSGILPGTVVDYAGATAPAGWLLCYGQAISRGLYAPLFAVISTTYGIGDGSTTFNLPDCRGRVIAGQDDMGGTSADRLTLAVAGSVNGDVLGGTGGAETHTLTTAQMAAHLHAVAITSGTTSADHTHSFTTGGASADHSHGYQDYGRAGPVIATAAPQAGGGQWNNANTGGQSNDHTHSGTTGVASANHTHSVNGNTSSVGSDTAHNNVQPTLVLNKIIKY